MGWLFGNVALCEESPESAKAEPAKKEDAPKAEAKENSKSESTSAESEVKSGPKNTGDDPEIDAKETEKAVAQEEGKAQASSGEGMAEVSLTCDFLSSASHVDKFGQLRRDQAYQIYRFSGLDSSRYVHEALYINN